MHLPRLPMLIRIFAGFAGGLALAGAVVAQTSVLRTLPEDAKRGTLSHVRENLVNLNGRQLKLAPGAQIRGANNLIVLPVALPKASLVKYQLDASGELARAWVLTSEEAARPDKASPSGGLDQGRSPPHASPPPSGQQAKP